MIDAMIERVRQGEDPEDVLRETLAELEHDQWLHWTQAVASDVSPEKRADWAKNWVPYDELPEDEKDEDREWADKVLNRLFRLDLIGN